MRRNTRRTQRLGIVAAVLLTIIVQGLSVKRGAPLIHNTILDDSVLVQMESDAAQQASAQAQAQLALQELLEDDMLVDLGDYDQEEQVDADVESKFAQIGNGQNQCKARNKMQFIWSNYLQTESLIYGYDEEASTIQLKASVMEANAKKAEMIFKERMKKKQQLSQELDRRMQMKNEMSQKLDELKAFLPGADFSNIEQLFNTKKSKLLSSDQVKEQANKKKQVKLIQHRLDLADDAAQKNKAELAKQKRVLHIVPHSHTDDISSNQAVQQKLSDLSYDDLYAQGSPVGFVGTVSDILNSTLAELLANENRTFTFGDLKYFKQWYDELSKKQKREVKKVVANGQLDLVNGGWTPPDEALTQYDSLLDNFQVGQQFLVKEFGYQPRVSWQLDVNGVSQGYARLAKDIGFDMLIFSSASSAEKETMRTKKSHTQVWRSGSRNFGARKEVLAVTLDQGKDSLNSYCWPKGFWADSNYMIDVPMVLNKKSSDYKFDSLVKSFYADVSERFDQDDSPQMFQPFGCDMSFVDAKLNYKIIDKLIEVWSALGYDKDIEIKYSSPNRFYKQLVAQNALMNKTRIANNKNNTNGTNSTNNSTEGWPVRKDDTFPYQSSESNYLTGYYSARPHLKKMVREFSQTFHSSLRLLSQQVLRKDLDSNKTRALLEFQTGILESLGGLQSQEAITGSSNSALASEYYSKARDGKKSLKEMSSKLLIEKLNTSYGIQVQNLDSDMKFQYTDNDLTSPYSHKNDTMIIIQNPSQNRREEMVEIQMPYYNFTIEQILNGTQRVEVKFDKFLPRVWQNSQNFVVPSLAQFKVAFENPNELFKVFLVKGLGVLRKPNPVPYNYQFKFQDPPRIWNLNLPVFLPKNGWEINNFQQNFLTLLPNMTIKSGTKSLQFLEIVKKRQSGSGSYSESSKASGEASTIEGSKAGSRKGRMAAEPQPVDSRNSTAPLDPQLDDQIEQEAQNATTNLTASNSSTSGNQTSANHSNHASGKKAKNQKANKAKIADENEGAAVFLYKDSATGISQKFAFSLRYYIGSTPANSPLKKSSPTGLAQQDQRLESGVYSFTANGSTKANQKSYRYGEINLKRSKRRANNETSEFLLVYEQRYGGAKNASSSETKARKKAKAADKFAEEPNELKIRAHVRIDLNSVEDFIKFQVSTNEVPVFLDKTGKDIVVDWFLMDGFDTDDKLWVDANGLQMVPKTLNQRKEYKFNSSYSVSSNYYPMTSAVAVRDFNKSNLIPTMNCTNATNATNASLNGTNAANGTNTTEVNGTAMNGNCSNSSGSFQKQVIVMTDRSQGASAGLRQRKNIEIMHQRRYRRANDSKDDDDALNDLDGSGRGIQVKETYHMQISKVGQSNQRPLQRSIDQPLQIYSSQQFALPFTEDQMKNGSNGTNATYQEQVMQSMQAQNSYDLWILEKIRGQVNESEELQNFTTKRTQKAVQNEEAYSPSQTKARQEDRSAPAPASAAAFDTKDAKAAGPQPGEQEQQYQYQSQEPKQAQTVPDIAAASPSIPEIAASKPLGASQQQQYQQQQEEAAGGIQIDKIDLSQPVEAMAQLDAKVQLQSKQKDFLGEDFKFDADAAKLGFAEPEAAVADEKAQSAPLRARQSAAASDSPPRRNIQGESRADANVAAAAAPGNSSLTNATANKTAKATYNKDSAVWYNKFNQEFKQAKTVKLIPFGVQKNQIMIRLVNLEDRFDGEAKTYRFDVNAWAREFYIEANQHLLGNPRFRGLTMSDLVRGIRLNITEMNLSGSIPKSLFQSTYQQTQWLAQGSAADDNSTMERIDGNNTMQNNSTKSTPSLVELDKEPKDNIQLVKVERAKGSLKTLRALTEDNYIISLEPQAIRMFSIQYFMPLLTV